MFETKAFISTTLPYSNFFQALTDKKSAPGHIGHLFEFVLADVIVRYYRNKLGNDNVLFNTGVDEHGQKILECAQSLNMAPQAYCDAMAEKWKEFCSKFQISYNNFYRTSDVEHKEQALLYFQQMVYNGDIYKKLYTGIYCKGCESFKLKKDLIDGKCEQHPSIILEQISEENFFIKLSRLAKNAVHDHILVDSSLNNELKNLIENAEDMSVSRDMEKVSWAIQIPNTDQTMYVWYDAIQCYMYAAGYKHSSKMAFSHRFTEWWGNSMIICGKDNLRFQALFLPCLLKSKGIPGPTKVLVHGTILDEKGNKMSKSEGNVIDPIEQLEKYGVNALRYYLMTGLNTFGNSKFSEVELVNKYNSELADGYGNLMARTLHLINIKNVEIDDALVTKKQMITDDIQEVNDAFISCNIRYAYQLVSGLVNRANVYIAENKPYADDCPNRAEVLNNVYSILKEVSVFYKILMPDLTVQIDQALQEKKKVILFKKLEFESITENR